MTAKASIQQIKERAEDSLYFFACLVNPSYLYAAIHKESLEWLSENDSSLDQLLLLPRGHLKSHLIATWCAWWITKFPETTILYVSATDDLAKLQLSAIKNILTSDIYRRYWPDMVHPEEGKREVWNVFNIQVDHPKRRQMGVRDHTVAARSVESNTTGLHCDVLIFDDLVVPGNAYSESGRSSVSAAYSQFSSVINPGGITKAVGTRYHGKDIYDTMLKAEVELFDAEGNITGTEKLFTVFERKVETDGEFLWPRTLNPRSNKWFGFDNRELAKIRAKYFAAGERAQYYAQYYNNPNNPEEDSLTSDSFVYYDRKHLRFAGGYWWFKSKRLAVFAAGDLAYTNNATSDYTAFAVIGVDEEGFIYVLELDQIRTIKYDVMYKMAMRLHDKWDFRKLRMETNAGANLAVEYMKDEARKEGKSLVIEGKRSEGEKSERCEMILMPRYENKTVLHFLGGLITTYEEQLTQARPSHDDLRDAVAAAVEISKVPAKQRQTSADAGRVTAINPRFGGRVR